MRAALLVTLALAATALASFGAAPARAGEYWVHACTDSEARNDALSASWVGNASVAPAGGCLPLVGSTGGLRGGAFTRYGDLAAWGFCAPDGTRVSRWSVRHSTEVAGSGFVRQVDTGSCGGYGVLDRQAFAASTPGTSYVTPWEQSAGTTSAGGIRLATWCTLDPCAGNFAFTHLRELLFLIDDYTAPALTNARGPFGEGGWARGDWDVAFDAADSTGIRAMEAHVDYDSGARWVVDDRPCQPADAITRLNPCEEKTSSFSRSLDTRTLTDGEHSLSLWARDGGGNRAGPRTHAFRVDNSAPAASLDRPAGSYGRGLSWHVADAASGVDAASLAPQWSADGGRSWQPLSGAVWDGAAGRFSATLPEEGRVMVRLSGADRAHPGGNRFTSLRTVRVDETPPTVGVSGAGAPGVPHPGPVTVALAGHDVVSGVADVLWRLDDAREWTSAGGDEAEVRIAGEGEHTLDWYAVDRAGNRSPVESRVITIRAGADGPAPGASQAGGFADRSVNPATTFTAARRFGEPCPAAATLIADRTAALTDRDLLVGFQLPAAPDCTVASATLRVHALSADASARVTRAGAAWDAASVDWDTRPGTVGASIAAPGAPGWIEWDVTAQVGALYRLGDNGLWVNGVAADLPAELIVRFAE